MPTTSPTVPPTSTWRALEQRPLARAELAAAAWEVFSVMLFAAAVVPAALSVPPAATFAATLVLSAWIGPRAAARGRRAATLAASLRAVAWPASLLPLPGAIEPVLFVPALAFGIMAATVRRAVYLRASTGPEPRDAAALRDVLRARVSENAALVGIVGGHVLLLFAVAFLRTQSRVMFRGWWEVVPVLAIVGTAGFTLAVRPATRHVLHALSVGASAPRAELVRGLEQAQRLPATLSFVNFATWLAFTTIGVFYFRPGPAEWNPSDAVMQLLYGALFSWGVAFYQRGLHEDTVRPVVALLARWTGDDARRAVASRLEQRMLADFGLPYAFTAVLSLLSTIALYRTLATDLTWREDFNAILALVTSFTMLGLAVGSVIVRAARAIARPLGEVADAAETVAAGKLDAQVPEVRGAVEVVGLAESVERMRGALASTIAELEDERAHLEANVEARTAELRRALSELRAAQIALVHTERLASLGELVANVAHEIGNPLNAIAGSSGPLEQLAVDVRAILDAYRRAERDLPDERRRELEVLRRELDLDATLDDLTGISSVIRRATERSVRIVQNLKNFSRTTGEPMPSDLHAGIDETLLLLGPRLRQACIRVERRLGELPPVVCRAGEVNQVFMNVFMNSIQALETVPASGEGPASGDAAAVAREREIVITTRTEGETAVVVVEDNGPGVPAGMESRIFDPFFTTKPRGQGTGLGLSISTEIIRRHGGSLTVEASERGGARLVCRLPIEGPKARDSLAPPSAPR